MHFNNLIFLGNAIAFVGCILMVGTGFLKKKSTILTGQCIQFGFQGVGHLILGSAAGTISCGVSIVRILAFTKMKVTVWLKLGFIALQMLLTLATHPDSIIQWLPVMAMVLYTWYLDTENPVIFKLVNMVGCVCWVFHDLYYSNYISVVFDILAILSTTAGILLILREQNRALQQISGSRA